MSGMDETQSVMSEPQAKAAIAVCRKHLLGRWA
jgi:hypothetical protein